MNAKKSDIWYTQKTEVFEVNKNWKEEYDKLKHWFNSTQLSLVHGICQEEGESWKIYVMSRAQNAKVKLSTVAVDTAYMNLEFGKTFAKLVYNKLVLVLKKFTKYIKIQQYT